MTANELRRWYMDFFMERGHQAIASASLLPENDPTVLFTTAGMHPLVPYLLGEQHPQGKRLTNVQKCVRTVDIDEVGDDTHLTFFEMLGNWSMGDYFKEESISMSYDFLTQRLHIPKKRLAVTVFAGDEMVKRDTESAEIWKKKGLQEEQIFYYDHEENWWGPVGQSGPCGSDTEIFYDFGQPKCGVDCGPACKCGKYVEIWNNVFLQYQKEEDGSFHELQHKNVDTGMGMERVLMIMNGLTNIYDTELFVPIMQQLDQILQQMEAKMPLRDKRIVCEHIRVISFILGDSRRITPSNTEQGYIVRRLIRRVIRLLKKAGMGPHILSQLARVIIAQYQDVYGELLDNEAFILEQLEKEYQLFGKTLDAGLKKAERYLNQIGQDHTLSGALAFQLYDTYGFPIEFTVELAEEKGGRVNLEEFQTRFSQHQERSRQGAEGKFKGGLVEIGRAHV